MSVAYLLVELMFCWMEQREECATKLEKLAQELESYRGKSNVSKAVGSTVTVAGSACVIAAGLATAFTLGAAAPLIGLAGGVCTGVGVGISLITKLIEHLVESDTMKDAKEAERKVSEITKRIQRLFEQLKEECKRANPNADPDDLDQHVMTEIVGAIAKRSGLNPRSIKHTLRRHSFFIYNVSMISSQSRLEVQLAGLLTFFCLKPSGMGSKIFFAKGAEQLIKEVSITGVKAVLKGGAMAAGGAIGMAFALPEAINHWKDLIKDNNVTEASKSLRDTSDALRHLNRTLRAQLDDIKQMLQKLEENSNRNFIKIITFFFLFLIFSYFTWNRTSN